MPTSFSGWSRLRVRGSAGKHYDAAMSRVVLLLGAGATVSDVATRPLISRPPLDKRFFAVARSTHPRWLRPVAAYMSRVYGVDITRPAFDSLEGVMSQIYTDVFNPVIEDDALLAFRNLLKLFAGRLAKTTNDIRATNKRFLYRMVTSYLSEGIRPGELTIITFNQDLQVEKILYLMRTINRWSALGARIFNFPGCYQMDLPASRISAPPAASVEVFPIDAPEDESIELLKLHGSLNWYSTHNSSSPSPSAMFNPARNISMTGGRRSTPR
jgi:hypothetical protein